MVTESTSNKKDACPEWADEAIAQLKQIEIYLGNIPSHPLWQSHHLEAISKRAFSRDQQTFDEEKAEFVFKKIVRGLVHEGFSTRSVMEFINARIAYKNAPPYCNEAEVEEILHHAE
jgi:hypothetical protein